MKIHRTLLYVCMFLMGPWLFAESVVFNWQGLSGVKTYEYEVSQDPAFNEKKLIRQGSTRSLFFKTGISPGVYFFRVRGIFNTGKRGPWSQAERKVIQAPTFKILSPKNKTSLGLANKNTEVIFEWEAVEGAQDYILTLQHQRDKAQRSITPNTRLGKSGLRPGFWRAQVLARSSGLEFAKSDWIRFKLSKKNYPPPQILYPLHSSTINAWEEIPVKWNRKTQGTKSEILIRRMGQSEGIISREMVHGKPEGYTKRLEPGRYKIIVRDFYSETKFSSSQIQVEVKADPMGYHSQYFGITGSLWAGTNFGWGGIHSPATGWSHSNFPMTETSIRLNASIWDPWGLVIRLGLRVERHQYFPFTVAGFKSRDEEFSFNPTMAMGTSYKTEPWGPARPLWFKALVFWRQFNVNYDINPSNWGTTIFASGEGPDLSRSNIRLWGLILGSEFRYGTRNASWDLATLLDFHIPVHSASASLIQHNTSFFPGSINISVLARKKLDANVRLVLGTKLNFEDIRIASEQESLDTRYGVATWGVFSGLDWDL